MKLIPSKDGEGKEVADFAVRVLGERASTPLRLPPPASRLQCLDAPQQSVRSDWATG